MGSEAEDSNRREGNWSVDAESQKTSRVATPIFISSSMFRMLTETYSILCAARLTNTIPWRFLVIWMGFFSVGLINEPVGVIVGDLLWRLCRSKIHGWQDQGFLHRIEFATVFDEFTYLTRRRRKHQKDSRKNSYQISKSSLRSELVESMSWKPYNVYFVYLTVLIQLNSRCICYCLSRA